MNPAPDSYRLHKDWSSWGPVSVRMLVTQALDSKVLEQSYCFQTERSLLTRKATNETHGAASLQDKMNDVERKAVSVFHQRKHSFEQWQFYSLRIPLASLSAHQTRRHRSSSRSQRSGRPQTRSCYFPGYEKEAIWRYQNVNHEILQMLLNSRTIREERGRDANNDYS